MRRRINIFVNIDWLSISLYMLLVFIGWINIYAAVYNEEFQNIFDITQRYGKQLVFIITALLIALIIFFIDSKFFSFFSYVIYAITIILLIIVLFAGKEIHGSRSWFSFGSFLFQPGEFAKVATCLVLAKFLSSYNLKINKLNTILKVAVLIFLPAALIFLQNDTGSAVVYVVFIIVLFREGISPGILLIGFLIATLFIITLLMNKLYIVLLLNGIAFFSIFWLLNRRLKTTGIGLLILVGITGAFWGLNILLEQEYSFYIIFLLSFAVSGVIYLFLAYRLKIQNLKIIFFFLIGSLLFTSSVDYVFHNILEEHQQQRINILLGIESDPLGDGYNVNQSKIAIGSGGLTGKGFLQGTQTKFNFVPEQSTDFIFCTIGEEWGFIGATIVISLFLGFLIRLIFLAERQRSVFSRVFGYGVVSILFFHFVINIGMTIGLLPVIGIPLPFFSYGGLSLMAFTILVFIFLRLDASRLELLR